MSFREVRKFTSMMYALGYPRVISIENFRTPNFPLVAEILLFLVKSFEPQAEIPAEIDTESGRVLFIKAVVQFMETSAHIDVNTRWLYQADGYAVKELLKITSVLYNAMKTTTLEMMSGPDEPGSDDSSSKFTFNLADKVTDFKAASESSEKGASLYDLLGEELEMRKIGTAAINRPITEVEQALRAALKDLREQVEKTQEMVNKLMSEEAHLKAKAKQKKQELERYKKRLQTLQGIRPAYMDEYEKIEAELKEHYEKYVKKFHCLCSLEQQLDEYRREERESVEEYQKAIEMEQNKLCEEYERLMMSGVQEEDSDTEIPEDEGSDSLSVSVGRAGGRFVGIMQGGDSDESDGSEVDDDDDREEDDEEEDNDGNVDLKEEDSSLDGSAFMHSRPIRSLHPQILDDRDDDFD